MELFIKSLKQTYELLHKKELSVEKEIQLEKSGLNVAQDVNRVFFKNSERQAIYDSFLQEMHEKDEGIKESIESLMHQHKMTDKKSLHEIIEFCLLPYENRKLEVQEGQIKYGKIQEIMKDYKIKDSVAGYKRQLFEPLDTKLWKQRHIQEGDRMILYLYPREQAVKAFPDLISVLGTAVADKPKKYTKYASRNYSINDPGGLHMRPAAAVMKLAQTDAGDIWIRGDSREVNPKNGIMGMLMAAAIIKPDPSITVLYKPLEKAEEFYRKLETIMYDEKTPLLTRK